MAASKYDRELRFIDSETCVLTEKLNIIREQVPETPLDAAKKAEEVGLIEERLGELYHRKKEIEESYLEAGMEIPYIGRNLNANVYKEGAAYEGSFQDTVPEEKPRAEIRPTATEEELTEQIGSITDEMMQTEIKMLQAELSGDDGEKQKLSMCISSLRSRRDYLVEQIKALRNKPEPGPEPQQSAGNAELEAKIKELENDSRALRSQISGVRVDVAEMKDQLRQILLALNIDQ